MWISGSVGITSSNLYCHFQDSFDSMEPAFASGDNILVNKWVMGARIFNIWDAAEGKEVRFPRLPG